MICRLDGVDLHLCTLCLCVAGCNNKLVMEIDFPFASQCSCSCSSSSGGAQRGVLVCAGWCTCTELLFLVVDKAGLKCT